MSVTEILEELPRLDDSDRRAILRKLVELDAGHEIDETREMLDAIEAGIRSMETGEGVSLEDVSSDGTERRIRGACDWSELLVLRDCTEILRTRGLGSCAKVLPCG